MKPEASFLAVRTRVDFVSGARTGRHRSNLSDFDLPVSDGQAAAEIVRTKWWIIPFIFVSGSLVEELVIDSFKYSATDFVSKSKFLF